ERSLGLTQPDRVLSQRLKNWLEIEGGLTDNLKELAGGGLMLLRLFELALQVIDRQFAARNVRLCGHCDLPTLFPIKEVYRITASGTMPSGQRSWPLTLSATPHDRARRELHGVVVISFHHQGQ